MKILIEFEIREIPFVEWLMRSAAELTLWSNSNVGQTIYSGVDLAMAVEDKCWVEAEAEDDEMRMEEEKRKKRGWEAALTGHLALTMTR